MHKQPGSTIELPETPSFQEAFAAAKVEHSAPETEHAHGADGTASDEGEGQSSEQPDEKAASARTETAETKPATPAQAGKADTGLLSDEEFTTLQTKHANDPIALRKALEG